MRHTLLLFSLICATILFTANTSVKDGFFDQFTFWSGKVPDLPENNFNYKITNLPQHLFGSSSGSVSSWNNNSSNTTVFDNITDAGATLGRVLFYDELLSANNNLSCATCHVQSKSFADDVPFSMGVSSATDVNSMHLNDLGWSNRSGFFWDMSQTNLETMIALPLANPNEIGVTDIKVLIDKLAATSYYPDLFAAAFSGPIINDERIRNALSQFISSMTTFSSKFDRASMGITSLTVKEFMGKQLFFENCSVCHTDGQSVFVSNNSVPISSGGGSSAVFFAPFLFDNGLPLETDDLGAGNWASEFNGLFKVPTLRNIEKTGPYMHDGRFDTLEDVIDHYSEEISESVAEWNSPVPLPPGGFDFSDEEKENLLAFLKTMTDHHFLTDEKFSDPFAKLAPEEEEESEEEPLVDPYPVRNTSVVYPNPTAGKLNIGFENINRRLVEVYLMDKNGKVLRKMSSHANGLETDLSLLPKGTYTVRVMVNYRKWEDHEVVVI